MATQPDASTTVGGHTAPEGAAPPVVAERERPRRRWLLVAPAALFLLLWELVANLYLPQYVARPSRIIRVFPEVVADGAIWEAVGGTMLAVVQGLVIGMVTGLVAGLFMGRVRWIRWATEHYVYALYAMPVVAIIPLATLWLGYSSTTRLVVTSLSAFLPIAVNVMDGTRAVNREYIEVARSFHARTPQVWLGVALPAAAPFLVSGAQLAAGRALVNGVVLEMFIALPGLGFFIFFNVRSFRHDEGFVGVIFIAAFGLLMLYLIKTLSARLLPWYGVK